MTHSVDVVKRSRPPTFALGSTMASLAPSTDSATATTTTAAATVTRVETGAASEEPPCKGSDVEAEGILKLRRQHMADNLSISYRTPLHIVRGTSVGKPRGTHCCLLTLLP